MCVSILQGFLEPVYFYIYTVFSLQAVYVIALYLTSWLLSGCWLSGALTAVWYILNRYKHIHTHTYTSCKYIAGTF